MTDMRIERDFLGEVRVPAGALWGVHTARAVENFPLAGRPIPPSLICAYGSVKLACALVNRDLGVWCDKPEKADAIVHACREMESGLLNPHVPVDLLQGGAGTSTNLNVSEVLANRALQLLGHAPGRYDLISPTEDLNRHQSTNDTYPTALKLAAITAIAALETRIVALQESFQAAEKRFAHIVKIARTEMQDAVLTTLGRAMAAYADALSRDRWRIYKCQERLRLVNLGGTAIGTGLGAPRDYIFRIVDKLREVTGANFARADNLLDATQNADVFAEVSGLLKAHAVTLLKICGDLRLLSSGPQAGLGELILPPRQAGSSIMPRKVNPVIPEAVTQAAMLVIGHDVTLTMACAAGSLELNPFLPLVAACLLESIDVLARANDILRRHCVDGLQADEDRCVSHVAASSVVATALVEVLGYEQATLLSAEATATGKTLREIVIEGSLLTPDQFDSLLTPEAVCRLGSPELPRQAEANP
jgi:aspartate ammonia-lyase